MMYESKMVCCLKANGKVLREFKDTVYVPFGSEYSILLKNLNSVRAIVNITIDGTEAVPGGLVVNANQEVDLERFVKDMTTGNRFKFIERTSGVEQHRGVKTEDGLIRVSFKYAKVVPQQSPLWGKTDCGLYPYQNNILRGFTNDSFTLKASGASSQQLGSIQCSATAASFTHDSHVPQMMNQVKSDIGITVPGSRSDQKFVTISDFVTESEEHVIVLKILGETETGPIVAPVTVKAKPRCVTCGRVNKATSAFCSACGTSLTII